MNYAQAILAQKRVNELEALMYKAQDDPRAWKRTLGCPGSRYLPEWERLMEGINQFLAKGNATDVARFCDYFELSAKA